MLHRRMVFILVACLSLTWGLSRALSSAARPMATPVVVAELARPTMTPTAVEPLVYLPTYTPSAVPTLYSTLTPIPTLTAVPLPSSTPTQTPSPTLTALPTATETHLPTATTPMPLALPTPNGVISRTVRVPILMYHYVSSPPEDASQVRINLSLEPDDFRAQMQYLADYGYNPIDLYDVSLAITNKTELPPKPVILTFDDGYIDAYEVVYPILEEFGFKGTFFIITEYVDGGNPNHMNWAMIEEMSAAGHRMEPHTKTHPDLSTLGWDGQIYQILGAQETLAAHIGYAPRFLCYPAGRYNEETIEILEQLDFWGAVTTQGGKWHNFEERYEWKRLRISYTTTLGTFVDLVKPADAEN